MDHRLFSDAASTAEVMVLNDINMLPLSETEMTGEDKAVIYFKILSWNHKDNEKNQDSQYSY